MAQADPAMPREFGRYRLHGLLGHGGMGDVYEALDVEKNRIVALKVLAAHFSRDQAFRARFRREARAAASVEEPHVIPIHDWGEIDGNLYIDMRLVRGQTLQHLIDVGPLPPARAVAITAQIAAALDAAHAAGLVHRDVKPQNVIVTATDFVYLLDFGIAHARNDTHLTMTGQWIGSLDYMAPERFGVDPPTPAVDIYALTCVLYQMLTGAKPFPGDTLQQLMAAHLNAVPPRPSMSSQPLPAALDAVVACGMAKNPRYRYPTATALAAAATAALRPQPTHVEAGWSDPALMQPAPVPVSHDKANPILIAAGIVAGLVVVALVGVVITVAVAVQPATSATAPTTRHRSSTPTVTVTGRPDSPTAAPAPSPTEAAPTSLQRLNRLASDDHSYVTAYLADRWVPQLSSKRPGVVDDGIVWDNDTTLQEHLRLRQRYPSARLLWSGDWSTFSAPDFWVTIVGFTFADSSGALTWCRNQGFDRDHCAAKIVSTTRSAADSTAYN